MSDFLRALPLWLGAAFWLGMVAVVMAGLTGRLARRTEDGLLGALGLVVAVCLALYPHWLARAFAVLHAVIGAVGVYHYLTRSPGVATISGTRWLMLLGPCRNPPQRQGRHPMTRPAARRLYGVVYPDPTPPPDGPPYNPPPDSSDELAMARHHVRTAFDPPLPDAFADWLVQLHSLVSHGATGDYPVAVPEQIRQMGYTFAYAYQDGDLLRMGLDDALRAFNRHDMLTAQPTDEDAFPALAAALVAHGIRTTTTIHHAEHAATVRLNGAQAKQLADALIPAEGSSEDDLALALELLDHFVDGPEPTPCWYDHHGHCQEHHDDLGDGRFAQHEGHTLLVRHGVREEQRWAPPARSPESRE